MSEANKRENLLPLLDKQQEIIESLTQLCKVLLNLLSQHISVADYEHMLTKIMQGDDVAID